MHCRERLHTLTLFHQDPLSNPRGVFHKSLSHICHANSISSISPDNKVMSRKSVLVTGCSEGGIGDALAQAFQRKGLHVFATARSSSKIAHLSALPNVTCIVLDVTSKESIETAVQIVNTKTGSKLDFLINNAGLGIVSPAIDADIKDAKKMFDANFWGAVEMVQAFSPLIISSKGTIGNVAALGAILHVPWMCKLHAPLSQDINLIEDDSFLWCFKSCPCQLDRSPSS
jgi:hypothetical protein